MSKNGRSTSNEQGKKRALRENRRDRRCARARSSPRAPIELLEQRDAVLREKTPRRERLERRDGELVGVPAYLCVQCGCIKPFCIVSL